MDSLNDTNSAEKEINSIPIYRIYTVFNIEAGKSFDIVFHRPNERFDITELNGRRIYANFEMDPLTSEEDKSDYMISISKSTGEILTPNDYRSDNLNIADGSVFFYRNYTKTNS